VSPEEFERRTKALGLAVIKLVDSFPRRGSVQVIGTQLLRAATSVGANYRAACRGRSPADVTAKLSIVLEEADETAYWLELLLESGHAPADAVDDLITEADEITAMTVASLKTLKSRYPRHGAHSFKIDDCRLQIEGRRFRIRNLESRVGNCPCSANLES